MDFRNIGPKEIMAINSLPVLAGTVATLHAVSAVISLQDYRYALRCKKAGMEIKVKKPIASNVNKKKGALDKAEYRLKLGLRGGLRTRLHIV